MNNFKVISKKFYNQYRNGITFASNLTEYTERLQGNSGEILQLIEQIEISTTINASLTTDIEVVDNTTTVDLICDFLNFQEEGLYVGAALTISANGSTWTGTVSRISGSSKQILTLDTTARTGFISASIAGGECRKDIFIGVTTRPEYLNYKYGLNPNNSTAPNYKSPLDSNEQSYYLNGITGSYQSMVWTGREVGSSLGSVRVKFDSTASYVHTFTVEHTFKLPYYKEGEYTNLTTLRPPAELQSSNTIKYSNGFFFGGDSNNITLVFEDLGDLGNVGYFNSNFSGKDGVYTVSDYAVSNASGTGFLEATEVNTVTFKISGATFVGGEQVIITHSMLPSEDDYSRSSDTYDNNFLFENITQVEGAAPVSGTIITNYEMAVNMDGDLEVTFDIQYTTDQQKKIGTENKSLVYATLATTDLSDPINMDRTNLFLNADEYTINEDVKNLITGWQPTIYEQWDSVTQTKGFSNFDGYNGDLLFMDFTFDTDTTRDALITAARFKVVIDNGTINDDLFSQNISLPTTAAVTIGSNPVQILNVNYANNLNFSSSNLINKVIFKGLLAAGSTQTFIGSIGFNVPWREWIQNLNIPTSFTDLAEPNNNRNERSSNYSGVSGYTIKAVLELDVSSTPNPSTIKGDTTSPAPVTTRYQLLSDASSILDYDDAGGSSFAATTTYYNSSGAISTDIDTLTNGKIEVEFTHALGTIALVDLAGYIKIESDDSTVQPFYLSTDIDMTDPFNPLVPSDTLASGNYQYVEVVSANNLVTFICYTNHNNLVNGVTYRVNGRLSYKK